MLANYKLQMTVNLYINHQLSTNEKFSRKKVISEELKGKDKNEENLTS